MGDKEVRVHKQSTQQHDEPLGRLRQTGRGKETLNTLEEGGTGATNWGGADDYKQWETHWGKK